MAELRRSDRNRKLFGVCGGLAERYGIEPVLVRVAFVVFALMGGPGLLAYLLLALVMPSARALPDHGATASLPWR